MNKVVKYYADGCHHAFDKEEDALAKEAEMNEDRKRWLDQSSKSKLEKLLVDLNNATFIHPETIATCMIDTLVLQNLVKVCQKFAEENKDCLKY